MKKLKKYLLYLVAFALGALIATMFSWSIYVSTVVVSVWCIRTLINDIKD